jgi:hypothetical protein
MAEEKKSVPPAGEKKSVPPAKKVIPPRPPATELKPIIAGRLWIGIGLLLGLGLVANPAFNQKVIRWAPPEDIRTDFTKWKAGGETTVRVTVITGDSTRLSCAHSDTVQGLHCAYGKDRLVWPRTPEMPAEDNGKDVIQPYRTSPDNALILLAGIWAQPEVAMRLHREPPSAVPTKRQNRFDVTCKATFLKKLDTVELRWDVTGNWQTERNAWVARAENCQVNNS